MRHLTVPDARVSTTDTDLRLPSQLTRWYGTAVSSGLRTKLSKYASELYAAERSAADALALARLAALPGGPLPWTNFSMRPAAIETAVSDVLLHQRRTIVECGSGNSTIYLARLLRRLDHGHLVTIEHDEKWADLTSALLAQDGLAEWVTIVHAPLVEGWYDTALLPEVEEIELLVIDGPPANTPEIADARYPAWPHFAAALAPRASVLLDDVDRPGEKEVLTRWAREYGVPAPVTRESFALIRT